MVVMALAAILTAMALPAFSALINGNSVATTCGLVKNTLDLAQARAVNDRKYVATVIDLSGTVSGFKEKGNDVVICQAMRNCYVSGSYEFLGWVDGADWVKLDRGAQMLVFAAGEAGAKPSFPTSSAKPSTSALQTVTGVAGAATGNLPGIVYATYGNVKQPGSSFYIGIGEATLANGNYIYKSTNSDGSTANGMAVTVNSFTGRSLVATLDKDGKIEK